MESCSYARQIMSRHVDGVGVSGDMTEPASKWTIDGEGAAAEMMQLLLFS